MLSKYKKKRRKKFIEKRERKEEKEERELNRKDGDRIRLGKTREKIKGEQILPWPTRGPPGRQNK